MRLTREQVAQVRACEGLYRASDVARHYGVNKSTVSRVWNYQAHTDVKPAEEPPNITGRVSVKDSKEDILILLNRGMGVREVADTLDISVRSIYAVLPKGVLI